MDYVLFFLSYAGQTSRSKEGVSAAARKNSIKDTSVTVRPKFPYLS